MLQVPQPVEQPLRASSPEGSVCAVEELLAELAAPRGPSVRRFRFGNHPVRLWELEREFGLVRTVGFFTSRTPAEELQRLLNARGGR